MRQTLVIALSGLFLLSIVAVLLRRGLLSFRYAAGWTLIALIAVLGAALARLVSPVADILSASPTGLLLALVSLLLLSITLLLSIAVSQGQERTRDLAEAFALASMPTPSKSASNMATTGLNADLLVVVPALNEEASVGAVVTSLQESGFNLVVIDDGSTDRTGEVAANAGAPVLSLPFNIGVGGALRVGFKWAVANGYSQVVQCDADGQHLPSEISALLAESEATDCDMVIGSRFAGQQPELKTSWHRRVAQRCLSAIASRAADVKLSDSTSGFRLIKQPLLGVFAHAFPTHYLGDTFEAVVAAGRAGYRVREVPVRMTERPFGQSSASFAQALRLTARALLLALAASSFRIPPQSNATGGR